MIGGNTTIKIQTRTAAKNAIGEQIETWTDAKTLKGWLDFASGDATYGHFNAKIQESTHIFVCDYAALSGITAENSRFVDEEGLVYEITLIDDPMRLHYQLEIYLKFTGGQ